MFLFVGQGIDFNPHGFKLQPCDLLIDGTGYGIDLLVQVGVFLGHIFGTEGLVCKTHIHDARRDDPPPRPGSRGALLPARRSFFRCSGKTLPRIPESAAGSWMTSASPLRSSSTSKWPELATMAPSFIIQEVLHPNDIDVAGEGTEESHPRVPPSQWASPGNRP